MTDVPPETRADPGADDTATGAPPEAAPRDPRWWLPWAGLLVGVWATLPQYSGPTLMTEASKEVADHIIPGILVLIVSAVAVVTGRSNKGPNLTPFICGTVVLLAGFWMMATHIPLIVQAFNDEAPWAGTIYHSSAALATFGLGLMWVTVHWQDLAAIEAAQEAQKATAPPAEPGPDAG
ncbi:MAG: hypothetical protein ACRD12_02990 [Acidimicrobiales bacterium]